MGSRPGGVVGSAVVVLVPGDHPGLLHRVPVVDLQAAVRLTVDVGGAGDRGLLDRVRRIGLRVAFVGREVIAGVKSSSG